MYLLHRVSLQGLFHRVDGWGESRQVVDVSALFAEEVGMGLGQGVVAGVPLVDGERLDSTVVAQQPERVVDRGFGQGRYRLGQSLINLIHSGVGVVFHQVAHDSYTLKRRLDLVSLQAVDYIHAGLYLPFL